MKKKVGIIFVFFGPLPWYFSYFIHSCRYNPEFDFLIYNDSEPKIQFPSNVHFHKMTLTEFSELINQKLKLKADLHPMPYKFCDLRPAFGSIFGQFIKEYEFWGHGDIDIIFGKISNFITDEILAGYDVISMRHDYISSWFVLYRNSYKVNNMFRLSKDYEKVFTTEGYYNFDETNATFSEFSAGIPYYQIESEVESMTHLVRRLHDEHYVNAYFNMHAIEGLTGKIKWTEGTLLFKGQYEIILYHLLQLKKIYHPKNKPQNIPNLFYISSSRIYANDKASLSKSSS